MTGKKRTEARIRADIAHNKNRRGTPMLPMMYISTEQAAMVERLRKLHGSKKAGVMQAIEAYCELLDAQETVANKGAGDGQGN